MTAVAAPDNRARQVRRTTPASYGDTAITAVAWDGENSAMVEMVAVGLHAYVLLTREQLVAHRDAINAVLAETREPGA